MRVVTLGLLLFFVVAVNAQNTYLEENKKEFSNNYQEEEGTENEELKQDTNVKSDVVLKPKVDSVLLITNEFHHRTKTVEHSIYAVGAVGGGIVFPLSLVVTVPVFVILRIVEGSRYNKWNKGFDPRNPERYKKWRKSELKKKREQLTEDD